MSRYLRHWRCALRGHAPEPVKPYLTLPDGFFDAWLPIPPVIPSSATWCRRCHQTRRLG